MARNNRNSNNKREQWFELVEAVKGISFLWLSLWSKIRSNDWSLWRIFDYMV
ncbi:hypothetical protein HanPI659440_Chr00c21g0734941 [Helianthus annuus]|nr:hypothetical protein HanPI659440_Chr00c21g0734941 [Helianthus annuus]